MAIGPNLPSGVESASALDIEAWTVEQAAHALSAASIASPPPPSLARGASVAIDIPLDEHSAPTKDPREVPATTPSSAPRVHTVYRRRSTIERDSLRRREALLKGKEGSRRRQRWENDRLLSNPYAQPPLPSDWEVRPTYPVHSVPYFLAPLWDAELKGAAAAKVKAAQRKREANDPRAHGTEEQKAAARVPYELRARLKRARGAKGLLQDLEAEIRGFVEEFEREQNELKDQGLDDARDSEDEEIVFVGRNGAMSDEKRRERERDDDLRRGRLVFESLAEDHGAAFGRWLVHTIATYYGLETWSVTTGSPARREAYVGLRDDPKVASRIELPRPLWGLV